MLVGEHLDGLVNGILLLAEVEDISSGLGVIEDAVGARKGLNEAVVFQLFVDVEGVQVFGIEAGEEHVDDDGDIDFIFLRDIATGEALALDTVLDVLIVGVKLGDLVVGAVFGVVVGDDGFEGKLFLVRRFLVVRLFLGEVFLKLLYILIAFAAGGEKTQAMFSGL
ncbi:MAG: hypothetical protein WC124_01515 [Desulfoplanes sp.]